MKKIVLALVSLIVIGMFLVGCNKEGLAGEAVKVGGKSITLDCKSFGNQPITNEFCISQKYDTCVGGTLIARITYPKLNAGSLFTFPIGCVKIENNQLIIEEVARNNKFDSLDDLADFLAKNNLEGDYTIAGDKEVMVTCCRVR